MGYHTNMAEQTLSIPASGDFSFGETLHAHDWRHLAPFVWDEAAQTLSRPQQMGDGRILLLTLRPGIADTLELTCDPPGDPAELELLARRMLQMDMPLGLFHAFCAQHPELAAIPAARECYEL